MYLLIAVLVVTLVLLSLCHTPGLSGGSVFFASLKVVIGGSTVITSVLLVLGDVLLPLVIITFLF